MWWYMPVIPATKEAEAGGLQLSASLGNLVRTVLKIKRAGDVVQGYNACLACVKPQS